MTSAPQHHSGYKSQCACSIGQHHGRSIYHGKSKCVQPTSHTSCRDSVHQIAFHIQILKLSLNIFFPSQYSPTAICICNQFGPSTCLRGTTSFLDTKLPLRTSISQLTTAVRTGRWAEPSSSSRICYICNSISSAWDIYQRSSRLLP